MNAPFDLSLPLKEAHRQAIDEANRWRGRCVNLFARGELVIGEALLAETNAKPLPMLLSQRITKLVALIDGQPKKRRALESFELQIGDRNAIVHGSGKVFVDGNGQWLLTLHAVDRAGPIHQHILQDDAEQRARQLKSVVDRLAAAFSR
jgi:hypothetical protein